MRNQTVTSQSEVKTGLPNVASSFCSYDMAIKKIDQSEVQNLLHHKWYLDDGIFTGKDHALQTFAILCEQGHEKGLALSNDKCHIWSSSELLMSDK